ncbi:hypothetical protein H633G_08750 [Metarhizium anisopliae BRIP 53284]|nr:hypothetical protein H633G_08750 [Metarhizium anisopliae BRIP 53284]
MPINHPNRARLLDSLANELQIRYESMGEIADLEEAIASTRQAIDLTPVHSPDRAVIMNNLGIKLQMRYKRIGKIADLDEAITCARQSIDLTPVSNPIRGSRINNLGINLRIRYERMGVIANLEEAITYTRQAVDLAPINHPIRARLLDSLANELQIRYERMGEIADLEEAIASTRQALDLTPIEHSDRKIILSNLGIKLRIRYERTGEIANLEEAISSTRQAIGLTSVDSPDRATAINNLGIKLQIRYERTGEMADLEESITYARQAIDLTPINHPILAGRMNNLGIRLGIRYKRLGELADIEEAIASTRRAIDLTPIDHPIRADRMNNLGNKLQIRYKRTREIADLEEAISSTRQAVDLIPINHPNRARILSNLGIKLQVLYERKGEIADLEEAIASTRQAIDLIPKDSPDRAVTMNNLGIKLQIRYERTGEIADLQGASAQLFNAWNSQISPPFIRIRAAARCLSLLALQSKHETAAQLGQAVIDLLPTVSTRVLDRSDQQFVMSTFAGVAANVCAFLLACNRPSQAIEYLEKGRAVIIGQLVDGRSDISSLRISHPDIAHRFEMLRDEISKPVSQLHHDSGRAQEVVSRREAVARFDACVSEIRALDGYESFLLGQKAIEMQQYAIGGTIVVVNITTFRSDAILISEGSTRTLHLPKLLASDVTAWIDKEWTGRGIPKSERPKKNKEFLGYLTWLWDVCVKTIIDKVYEVHGATNSLPRIWWIGTGLGSSMPFHAAGVHTPGSVENALARAISSYTPSIKSLGYAQERARIIDRSPGYILLSTMPSTPGKRNLAGVVEETEEIIKITTGYMPMKLMDLPSVEQVVDSLSTCSIVHFACHGSTDHTDPSNSGLILQRVSNGGQVEQDRLTVRKVSELNLLSAQIAYLSACSTAENGVARLSDEVIHVVSGFQVAGFPHVIGCLWPSYDRACVEGARVFYNSLFSLRRTGWNGHEVAWAVREMVMALRQEWLGVPLAWAQFLHFGA